MTEALKILIRHRLDRAQEALSEASYLLQGSFINSTAARCYYACFYAVSALLLTKNLSSKTHKGMRVLLSEHYANPGILSATASRFYSHVFAYRQEGDYDDFPDISAETAQNLLAQSQEFVREVSTLTLETLA